VNDNAGGGAIASMPAEGGDAAWQCTSHRLFIPEPGGAASAAWCCAHGAIATAWPGNASTARVHANASDADWATTIASAATSATR